jgi:tRNA(Phe) wybutosine-synthesizing methylase Tyw3
MPNRFPSCIPVISQATDAKALPSFASIRKKTLATLYQEEYTNNSLAAIDKSPKGSVDAHIQDLVDLINQHPHYATLSSCSGRISLFDHGDANLISANAPIQADEGAPLARDEQLEVYMNPQGRPESGKGGSGRWLLVSHDPVEPEQVFSIFFPPTLDTDKADDTDTASSHNHPTWTFKLEPFLLHVAAANLHAGQSLLRFALESGLRESGLVVTPQRVTVALRTHSGALSIPLSCSGPLQPSHKYMRALIDRANQGLEHNLQQLQQLTLALQAHSAFFRPAHVQTIARFKRRLPDLNLWDAAAVCVRSDQAASKDENDINSVTLFVFGGYGSGPAMHSDSETKKVAIGTRRSSSIYSLSRDTNGVWCEHWQKVQSSTLGESNVVGRCFGLPCSVTTLPATQGCKAIVLSPDSLGNSTPVVALFGGRDSPTQPLGCLWLFDPITGAVHSPVDVRGSSPPPRWGHTWEALSIDHNDEHQDVRPVAVLAGGRNAHAALSCIFILSYASDTQLNANYLQWERLKCDPPLEEGRFCHATLVCNDGDTLFIFGGLTNPQRLLQPPAATVEVSLRSGKCRYVRTDGIDCAHGSALLIQTEQSSFRTLHVGGIEGQDGTSAPYHTAIACCRWERNDCDQWYVQEGDVHWVECGFDMADLRSMVHHTCMVVPSSQAGSSSSLEIALVGGGVMGFAFGECYAHSYVLSLEFEKEATQFELGKFYASGSAQAREVSALKQYIDEIPSTTNVLYVLKRDAKALKTALETTGYLDKRYRMGTADASCTHTDINACVAIPVTPQCLVALLQAGSELTWLSLVKGQGHQSVLLSSSTLGKQRLI